MSLRGANAPPSPALHSAATKQSLFLLQPDGRAPFPSRGTVEKCSANGITPLGFRLLLRRRLKPLPLLGENLLRTNGSLRVCYSPLAKGARGLYCAITVRRTFSTVPREGWLDSPPILALLFILPGESRRGVSVHESSRRRVFAAFDEHTLVPSGLEPARAPARTGL